METRTTKHNEVRKYLLEHKTITSIQAIELFGATRLSAIIFNLKKQGYDIATNKAVTKDRYGNTVNYAIYELIGMKED